MKFDEKQIFFYQIEQKLLLIPSGKLFDVHN